MLTDTERHDTSLKAVRMEWHLDARKGNSGETSLELDIDIRLLVLEGRLVWFIDALQFLDLLEAYSLGKLQMKRR